MNQPISRKTTWLIWRARLSVPALLARYDDQKVLATVTAIHAGFAILLISAFAWLTGLPYPMAGITPFYPPSVLRPPDAFYPRGAYLGSPSFPNGLSLFFSSASGGMGMRIGYDRRLSPNRKFTAGIEFLTYGYRQSLSKLGSDLPPDVTRISLISFPVGLRQEFAAENRVVPHLGFGVGPIVRFDHYPSPYLYGYPGSLRFGAGAGASSGGFSVGATIPLDGNLGLGRQSLTLGGFIGAGTDIRFGEHKDFALSLQGRYALAYFTDALGRPGDFSGLSFAVGFGKYF